MCVHSKGEENQDLENHFTSDAVSEIFFSVGVFEAQLNARVNIAVRIVNFNM
jgi:hypothetical protein